MSSPCRPAITRRQSPITPRKLGIPAVIVMPETTPSTKIERTRAHGAQVVLSGETLADSQVTAEAMVKEKGYVLIHPYDDDQIIAGQGTIGIEMLEDEPGLDCIVVPIGGGGVISGIAIAAKHIKPQIEMMGVEVKLYPSMYHALRGQPARCGGSHARRRHRGEERHRADHRHLQAVCRRCAAGRRVRHRARGHGLSQPSEDAWPKARAQPGLAAVLADPAHFRGRKVGLVLCGGNIDPRILASVIYRELEREHRIVNLRIQIDDRPGVLGRIASRLGQLGANILEVSHRRMFLDVPAKGAELEIMIETRDGRHAEEIVESIESDGFTARVLDAPGGQGDARRFADKMVEPRLHRGEYPDRGVKPEQPEP